MKLKKFTAPSTREALQKLRAELGEDAIILSTKRTAAGTEVLAAASGDLDNMTQADTQPQRSEAPPSWTRAERQQYEQSRVQSNQQASKVAEQVKAQTAQLIAPKAVAPTRVQHELPVTQPAPSADMLSDVAHRRSLAASQAMAQEQVAVLEEIKQMRQLLKDQMSMLTWRDSLDRNPNRAELWNLLTRAGFTPLFARTVVDRLPEQCSEAQAQEWVTSVLKNNLSVSQAHNDMVETGGTYALVGPTGVGKTTTTAKLAARCVVKYGADSLGLITTDSYRVGAQDQLRIYGKILGVQVYTAQNQADLHQLRSTMQRKRLILIDTVGMGQRDSRVIEHNQMLAESDVRRVLLLNATSQTETLDDVVRHYKATGLHGAIVTKLDEAIVLGGVLDVVMRHKLQLQYIATGQRVPEDLFLADPRVLVHRALKPRSGKAFDSSEEELKWKMAQVSTNGI